MQNKHLTENSDILDKVINGDNVKNISDQNLDLVENDASLSHANNIICRYSNEDSNDLINIRKLSNLSIEQRRNSFRFLSELMYMIRRFALSDKYKYYDTFFGNPQIWMMLESVFNESDPVIHS